MIDNEEVSSGGLLAAPGKPAKKILLCVSAAESAAFFPPNIRAALADLGEILEVEVAQLHDPAFVAEVASGVNVLVTTWGFPRLSADFLAQLPNLEFVMHAPSSIQALVSDDFWAAGIPISQAGAAMAPAVAEMSLTLTMALLRRTHRLDHAMRGGASWEQARRIARAREISGSKIAVIGASRTGRKYISACQALQAEVRVYDPYVPETDPLHTLTRELEELLDWAEVVALHAPETPETKGLISRSHIEAMAPGTLIVNTARPGLIDMDALYDAVASDRVDAALDVFDVEPLPQQDRWRNLPGVLLTPHLGGATLESRGRAGAIVLDEIRRHLSGEPLQHSIDQQQLTRMG